MTAKEYLSQPLDLNRQINKKMKLLESYKALAGSISSPKFDEKVQGTRNVDPPFVQYLAKIEGLETEIAADRERLSKLVLAVDEQISRLDSETEQLVLRYRYLLFMNMQQISERLSYSKRWTRQIHAAALMNFESAPPTSSRFLC